MDNAERSLRERVREISKREKSRWGVDDPRPLPVRWHVESDAVDHRTNIYGTLGGPQYEDLTAYGTFSAVREFYGSIPSQRMIIQGDPGAGKTVLAHHLITTLFDTPEDDQPVPVLFSVSTWNPNNTGLPQWLSDQLARDYPHLSGEHTTRRTLAAVLVRRNRILPVLDGFDEIPEKFRIAAIEALSRFDGPLIVTTRRDEYLAATGKARAIGKAEAIALDPPSLDDVRRYLHDSTGKTQAAAWTRVFDRIHAEPDDPAHQDLTALLSVPLMVTLARTVYRTTDHGPPTDLLGISRSIGRAGLEEHLLHTYIDTVYDPRHTPTEDSTQQPSWTPDQARRWLGHLADHLTRDNTHDLTWWQLSTTLPWWIRVLATMSYLGLALGLWVVLAFVLNVGLAIGLTFGLTDEATHELKLVFTDGLTFRLADAFTLGLATWATVGLTVGLTAGLINEASYQRRDTMREPEQLRFRVWKRNRVRRLTSIKRLAAEFGTGLTVGLTFMLTYGPTDGLDGLKLGLTAGLTFALANIVVGMLGDSQDSVSPWQLLSTDRTVTLVRALTVMLTVALTAGFQFGRQFGLTAGLAFGLQIGLTFALARLLLSAWGNWLVLARLWLPLTRRLPWRSKRFLEDAYQRGVLRQVGAVYQFHHAQLLDHLANRHRTKTTPPPKETPGNKDRRPASEPH